MSNEYEENGGGAKAALSGFRRQALYTLLLLIREGNSDTDVQPEGKEDIALFESGQLIRIIQVKAYKDPLQLSDLKPQKPGSFLHRTASHLETNTAVELASFGPLGPELTGWKDRDKSSMASLKRKLEGHGFDGDQAQRILEKIEISRLQEENVENYVYEFLKSSLTAGNPERSFELLNWWILKAAEKRQKLKLGDLRERIEKIGRYLAERQAHHDEWFKTIKPLESSVERISSSEQLAAEYYRGAAARFSHIEAELDVRRPELLSQIDQHFQGGKRVVILHGASGQGKTSLGLRYLVDFVPNQWRFLVEAIDDRKHAASIALALADHLHAVEVPVYLLIDVAPRDQDWVTLIRELLDAPNIYILIAIREEDLARRTVSENQLGFPADVRLEFNETEAHHVYERLLERGNAANAFPSFMEAWNRFGGKGPLLEFVYLITQTESLRAVLEAQVKRLHEEIDSGKLEPNALRLLQLCAIATAYEARILLKPAIELLGIKEPVAVRILNLFEDEYFLRVSPDRSQAESLHPVRSAILAEVLDDPTFAPTTERAREVMLLIPEADLEVFLLYLFSRHPESADGVLKQLQTLPVISWRGAAGVARALRWWGIRTYLNVNRPVFDRAKTELSDAWSFFMISDIAGAMETDPIDTMIDLVKQTNPQGASRIRELRSELTGPAVISSFVKDWITRIAPRKPPEDAADWEGWAELLYWAGRLGVEPTWPLDDVENIPIGELPIEVSAQICQALFTTRPELYGKLLQIHGDQLKKRFQEDTNTFRLDDGDELFAHFITPWEQIVERPQEELQGTGKADESSMDSQPSKKKLDSLLNDEAVHRAHLLRLLFPGKVRYCTQGYGQQLKLGEGDVLDQATHKMMPESSLPLEWLVQINATTRNLVKYADRPENWRDYAERLLRIRERIAATLLKMERRLVAYFKSKKPRQIIDGDLSPGEWQEALVATETTVPLPKTAVDEWGLSTEGETKDIFRDFTSRDLASVFTNRSHEGLAKPLRDYTTAATGFFRAAGVVCFCHSKWGREPHRRLEVENAFKEHGYNGHSVHLAKHNLFLLMQSLPAMQRGFAERLGGLVDPGKLQAVSNRENALFPGLWALWYQFCVQPDRLISSAKERAQSAFEQEKSQLKVALISALDSGDGWKGRILRDGSFWNNQRSLVIGLELQSIIKLEESRLNLLERLGSVLGGLGNGTLRQYALDYYWPQIIVIPTFRGQALEAGAWFIPSTIFFNASESGSLDRFYIRLLQPLPDEQLVELGLSVAGVRLGQHFDTVKVGFARWMLMLKHLASLTTLPEGLEGLDDIGEIVLNRYLQDLKKELNSLINNTLDAGDAALGEFRVTPEASHPLAQAGIIEPLQKTLDFIKLYLSGGQFSLSEFIDLSEKIQEVSAYWGLLRWLTIPGAIDFEALQEQGG